MKSGFKALAALLAIIGIGDLAIIPAMIHANHQHAGTPPMAAIVLSAALGVAMLACIAGLAQGRRWGYWTAMISLIVDAVNSLLGVLGGPGAVFVVFGLVALVVTVPAVVLLVRLNPRRAVRTASGA
jgi:hypothetical protein